eukprot:6035314-Pyramimonas_sp.AAC.1
MLASQHCFARQAFHKFARSLCHCIVSQKDILGACATGCLVDPSADPGSTDSVIDEFRSVGGGVALGGKQLHESHALRFWPRHSLYVCATCGRAATIAPRSLLTQCEPATRKGLQNLARIGKQIFPSYRGPSDVVKGAQASRVRRVFATSHTTPVGEM